VVVVVVDGATIDPSSRLRELERESLSFARNSPSTNLSVTKFVDLESRIFSTSTLSLTSRGSAPLSL
jgi:hypothetical protein